MSFYKHYAGRFRNPLGVKIKLHQAKVMISRANQYAERKSESVFEIGPGDGYMAEHYTTSSIAYQAIERSTEVVKRLESQGIDITQATCPPIPKHVTTSDLCYMLHVIEHMKDADMAASMISEIKGRLNVGGLLIIACPDYMKWKEYFYDCDYTHSLPFTKRRLRQLLIDEGFEVLKEEIYVGPVFGYRGLPIYWIIKLLFPGFLNDAIEKYFKHDFLNKAFLTFLPNLFVVAKKTGA
jgi:hypothetical protein